ncbi:HAD family hydrolase [Pseudonocardia alni]|uniref:HAD family hydrolase n=1 Tax=Pseudonocardia alni TaxID=33907 RepID=UPI003318CA57
MIVENAPRLVATDVDGTLLDDGGAVTPRTVAVLERAVAAGAGFVLVTGRPPRWIPPVLARLPEGLVRLCVCANGAVLYDAADDVVLGAHTLEPATIRELAGLAAELFPGCGFGVERVGNAEGDDGVRGVVDEFLTDPGYVHAWGEHDGGSTSREDLLGRPATKVLIRSPELTSEQMMDALAPKAGGLADLTFSHSSGLLEASAPGVTKATGLAEVARRFGVTAADTVAFGDMPNDREMLRWAGLGVAMGNAHPDLVGLADEVTAPHTHDGLAEILERWF